MVLCWDYQDLLPVQRQSDARNGCCKLSRKWFFRTSFYRSRNTPVFTPKCFKKSITSIAFHNFQRHFRSCKRFHRKNAKFFLRLRSWHYGACRTNYHLGDYDNSRISSDSIFQNPSAAFYPSGRPYTIYSKRHAQIKFHQISRHASLFNVKSFLTVCHFSATLRESGRL